MLFQTSFKPNFGGLFRAFRFTVMGEVKITPGIKLVTIKLVSSKFQVSRQKLEICYVSTQIYLVLENIPFSTNTPLILLMSAFLPKKVGFFVKNSTFTQNNIMRAVLEGFQFGFQFLQDKRKYSENFKILKVLQTMHLESSFRIASYWP